MPISKKDRVSRHLSPPKLPHNSNGAPAYSLLQVQREHRKAEKAGTRAPVKANGLPVKPPKPTSIV